MSECVVRMEFRKNCLDCDLHQIVYGDSYADTDVYCFKKKQFVGKRFGPTKDLARPDWCPIICSLPEGHGDLIDKESFIKRLYMYCGFVKQILPSEVFECYLQILKDVEGEVNKEIAIVPAERREE